MNKIPTTKIAAVVDAIATVPGVHRVRQSKGKIIAFNLKPSTEAEAPFVVNLNVETGDVECHGADGVSTETFEHHRDRGTLDLVRAAIAGAIESTETAKKYGRACLRNGRWVPARGMATWAEWRADPPNAETTGPVRITEQQDGLTIVVWQGHPDEMPERAPEPKAASSVETIGMLEANPLISTGDLDAIRDEANRAAKGLDLGGRDYTPINSAVQNPAAYARVVCASDRRDPRGDFVVIFTFCPTMTARTVATVREWLAAGAEDRTELIASAVGYLFNGGVQP